MTNFDRFLTDSQFTSFAEVAVSAEKIYPIDPAACVLNCRRSMEFAVKWMYSVDNELVMPYDDRLVSLMDAEDSGTLWGGPVAAAEVYSADGQRRRPHGKEDHPGAGPAVPGEPLHIPGLCSLLLWRKLHRGAV